MGRRKLKSPTGRVNVNWQEQQAISLWRIGKHLVWLKWSVFGLAVAYALNAVAGRIWP